MIIVLVFVHLFLGHEDLHTSFTFIPKSIGLLEFVIVEVNLTDKEQSQGPKVEIFSIDGLHLLNFEAVGNLAFLLDYLAQLLEE